MERQTSVIKWTGDITNKAVNKETKIGDIFSTKWNGAGQVVREDDKSIWAAVV